jgi:hypothetical protein
LLSVRTIGYRGEHAQVLLLEAGGDDLKPGILMTETWSALRTKPALAGEAFSGRRDVPHSMVMPGFANRTNKHGGSSANPPAASLNGEHNIIATNAC